MSQVLVFDLDDTLYPESAFVRSALSAAGHHAATAWGLGGLTDEYLRLFESGQHREIFQTAHLSAGHGDLADARAAELLRVCRTHRPTTLQWFPDAQQAVRLLARAHPLELISDGYLPTQVNKFEALGAGIWFPNPIFTEALGREFWKPSPRAFEEIMRRHPIASFTYIADNPSKDFVAPRRLGWHSIQVARPGGVYAGVPAHPQGAPDIVVPDLSTLPELISQLK